MSTITAFPFVRHLRSEPTSYVLHFHRGRLRRSGRGLTFWFFPLGSSVAEVPCDDRELPFLFHGRSSDFQDVTAQGAITFRVVDAATLAERIDFSLSLDSGQHLRQPLDQLATLMTQLAQQYVVDYLAHTPVRRILAEGVADVRERIQAGLTADAGLADMGLEVVTVRVSMLSPTAELEKALQTPMREEIQQRADEAVYQRRAIAVDKERAIAENELQNRIELSRRQQALIAQEGQNQREQAKERAEAQRIEAQAAGEQKRIAAEAKAATMRLENDARAEGIQAVEEARLVGERERMAIYRDLPPTVMLGLAARELATKLQRIDHLNLSPDALSPLLTSLMQAGVQRLGTEEA